DASLNITVRATSSDGSHADQSFTIAVNDVNEFNASPPTDSNGAADAVNENAATGTLVGITASSSDDDATNNTISYSLTDDANGAFQIDSVTGIVTVADGTQIDRESDASLDITVRATSTDGSTADTTFTIAINNLNDNPVLGPPDNDGASDTVAENAANGTAVGITALASDADIGATISYSLSND